MSTESLDKRAERVNYILKEGGELRTEMVIGLIDDLRAALAAAPSQADQPAAQEAGRVGLTEAQIKEACSPIFLSDYPGSQMYDIAIARAIERAHGIPAAKAEGER